MHSLVLHFIICPYVQNITIAITCPVLPAHKIAFLQLTLLFESQPAMGEVDPSFVQAIEHRPKLEPIEVADEIPVIELSNVLSLPQEAAQQVIADIGSACETWGFFQVVNHGVPAELRRKVEGEAKKFFDSSLEKKRKVKRDEVNAMGFYESEHTKNVRDWKEVFDFLVHDPTHIPASHEPDDKELRILTNQWPQFPADFR